MASNMELTVRDPRQNLNKITEEFYDKWSERFRTYHATYEQNCSEFEHYQQERVQISKMLANIVETLRDIQSDLEELGIEGTLHSHPPQEVAIVTKSKRSKKVVKPESSHNGPERSTKCLCVIS